MGMDQARSRILVVDDDSSIRELLRRRLASHYDVVVAEIGRVALNEINRQQPDLLITERMMPELDGLR